MHYTNNKRLLERRRPQIDLLAEIRRQYSDSTDPACRTFLAQVGFYLARQRAQLEREQLGGRTR
jgi:hypothetical protein